MSIQRFEELPACVYIAADTPTAPILCEQHGSEWTAGGVTIRLKTGAGGTAIAVHAPHAELSRIALRWRAEFSEQTLFLGDAWERGYGDLQWRSSQPERVMPWYFAAHDTGTEETVAVGVKTQPASMCFWTADRAGITLWLDFRNGGSTCVPGDRVIEAATIVTASSSKEQTPFALIRELCTKMCATPRLSKSPICGNNNWYYAYGQNFDAHQVLRDAALLAELAGDHAVRPYCVIDAGWSPGGSCPGGPWTAGRPDKFPDMPRLAEEIRRQNVKPGIWIRPTALTVVDNPHRLRAGPQSSAEKALDLTLPENLSLIHDDVARMHQWGYELIKHDFSTWDAFGRWGFQMGAEVSETGWHFADRSKTNAEIILKLYQTIRDAAGDAALIGCNTIGHLSAGLFELQRAGDDTSGKVWERTRRMGVNTLAFRLPQHGTFFAIDPDCVAHTADTPWEKDRQWLDLVARSGTSLFVSVDPTTITAEVKTSMTAAMRAALSKTGEVAIEPLDWLATTSPSRWKIDEVAVDFDWMESWGATPSTVERSEVSK